MAGDNSGAITSEYRPEMDGKAHERTYSSFTHFTFVGTIAVAAIVVALAIGGAKHAWLSCMVMVVLTLVATAVGLFSPNISWRAPAIPFVILVLMLILY